MVVVVVAVVAERGWMVGWWCGVVVMVVVGAFGWRSTRTGRLRCLNAEGYCFLPGGMYRNAWRRLVPRVAPIFGTLVFCSSSVVGVPVHSFGASLVQAMLADALVALLAVMCAKST